MKPVTLVIVLAVLAGGVGLFVLNDQQGKALAGECPTHWHATFGVYIPDASGNPSRIDMATPAKNGRHYYDYGVDPAMAVAAHMHQSGAEVGVAELGPQQFHYEGSGKCVSIQDSLAIVDIHAASDSLRVSGEHSQTHQDGTWTNAGNSTVRYWLQDKDGTAWVWKELTASEARGKQAPDGSSFLVAYGNYTPAQVASMQASITKPMSRTA